MMSTLATILALSSGFFLMRAHESVANIIATALVIDASLAPVTATIAARRNRSVIRWVVIGFFFGVWALAWALLLMPRGNAPTSNDFPPTSDAA